MPELTAGTLQIIFRRTRNRLSRFNSFSILCRNTTQKKEKNDALVKRAKADDMELYDKSPTVGCRFFI